MYTDNQFVIDMDELKSADIPVNRFFHLQVNYNNVKYEFLIRFSSTNKNLVCFGSGAYDPTNFKPPVYNRHSWGSEFEESVIYYNDPTLYNDDKLTCGWGVGKNEEWYISVVADIISILAAKNEIETKNILFFGSSAGGFTSVILSTLLKGSSVLVNNPQMFLRNYNPTHFNNMINACFDDPQADTILTEYGYRFDVIELFKKKNHLPEITYAVNINSEFDVKYQLIPFIESLASFENFDDHIKVVLYSSDDGHQGVLDKEETVELIKNHFEDESDQINVLMKQLETKDLEIAKLKSITGYIDYKVKNIFIRLKRRVFKGSK